MKSLSLRCCCSNGEALINLLSASAHWDSVKHKDVEEFIESNTGFENFGMFLLLFIPHLCQKVTSVVW